MIEYKKRNCCSDCGYYFEIEENSICQKCKMSNQKDYDQYLDQLRIIEKSQRSAISRELEKNTRTVDYTKAEFERLRAERKKDPKNSEKFKELLIQY